MKKNFYQILLLGAAVLASPPAKGQKAELAAGISGNLYNYGGTLSSSTVSNFYNITYSKTLRAGFGLQADLKLVDKDGFFFGISGGYDELNSKAPQPLYSIAFNPGFYPLLASYYNYDGYQITTLKEIYGNPYLGYRLRKRKFSIDFSLGADLAFLVESRQKNVNSNGSTTNTNYNYYKNEDVGNNSTDYRLRAAIGFNYHRFGLNVNYAHGVVDLRKTSPNITYYNSGSVFSQQIKLGVNYRIF